MSILFRRVAIVIAGLMLSLPQFVFPQTESVTSLLKPEKEWGILKRTAHCFGNKCVPHRAVRFLGNVCWDVLIPSVGDESGSLELGVTHMGGGHFVLNGVLGALEEGAGEVLFSLVRGNSEIVEDQRRLSLDNTTAEVFDDPVLGDNLQGNGAVVFNLFLDPTTLDGSGLAGGVQTGNLPDITFIGFLGDVNVKRIPCRDVVWRR